MLGRTETVRNAHHDLNNAPNRVVTVLIYLNTVPNTTGAAGGRPAGLGQTLFPCIGRGPRGALAPAEAEVCDTLRRGFRVGYRSLPGANNPSCWNATAVLQLQAQCADPAATALKIAPTKGAAAVFPARLRDGAPDVNTWHAACPVVGEAAEKVTIQFFKELPRVGGAWEAEDLPGAVAGPDGKVRQKHYTWAARAPVEGVEPFDADLEDR